MRYCNKNKILLLKQKIKAKNIKNSIFLNIVFFFCSTQAEINLIYDLKFDFSAAFSPLMQITKKNEFVVDINCSKTNIAS